MLLFFSLKIAFTARFFHQLGFADDDVMRQGFTHIVDGQGGDGSAGKGFHLHAGFAAEAGGTVNDHLALFVDPDIDLAVFQAQRVAERDQLTGFFGGHDPGDNGGLEYGAFGALQLIALQLIEEGIAQGDDAPRAGRPAAHLFSAHVDHRRLIICIEVTKRIGHSAIFCS